MKVRIKMDEDEFEEEFREEDRLFGRLMFDEICECRPNASLRIDYVHGVYTTCVHECGDWKVVGIDEEACGSLDQLIEYLGITNEEIDANLERRDAEGR